MEFQRPAWCLAITGDPIKSEDASGRISVSYEVSCASCPTRNTTITETGLIEKRVKENATMKAQRWIKSLCKPPPRQ